jgi:hypothetical protein
MIIALKKFWQKSKCFGERTGKVLEKTEKTGEPKKIWVTLKNLRKAEEGSESFLNLLENSRGHHMGLPLVWAKWGNPSWATRSIRCCTSSLGGKPPGGG